MNTQKIKLVLGLALVIGCAVAILVVVRDETARPAGAWRAMELGHETNLAEAENQRRPVAPPAIPSEPSSAEEMTPYSNTKPQPKSVKAGDQVKPGTQKPATPGTKTANIKDPVARAALSLVGADSEAEEYWIAAINDPNLSAPERQDLIEDLNEDGFSDPHHPTVDDLPLIVSRIWLIEHLDAMDQVNADAFQEAYKDLLNMYANLTRR